MDINGAIILYKEKGMSSFSAVSKVRKIAGVEKAGHSGTLDPMAEGLLFVCLGKHTRLTEYIMAEEKQYGVDMYLGISTDTYDLEGSITENADVGSIGEKKIIETIKSFTGEITQKPPVYSAVKVKGRKLYDYARKGKKVEIPSRKVYIKDIFNINIEDGKYENISVKKIHFDVICSKGTYIRSLCHDIGRSMNNYGTMAGLVRTRNGIFTINESHRLAEIESMAEKGRFPELVIDPIPYTGLERVTLNKDESAKYMKGLKFTVNLSKGDYLTVLYDGTVVGIGSVDDEGNLRSRKRLI